MGKNPSAEEKIMTAIANNNHHADSISINSDLSIAYCRQILNKMAVDGEIVKKCGRSHHSYHIAESPKTFSSSREKYKPVGYCDKFDDERRESVRNKYDRRCFICNAHEDAFAKRLSVHHVDRNRDQGCNEVDWKLVPLCASCHAQAHHEPLMSRINYLVVHEDGIVVADYRYICVEHVECDMTECTTNETQKVYKNQTRDKIMIAIAKGMVHTDSIAMHSDTSEAYCRRVLNELAADGEIQKIIGRSHHTYLPKED